MKMASMIVNYTHQNGFYQDHDNVNYTHVHMYIIIHVCIHGSTHTGLQVGCSDHQLLTFTSAANNIVDQLANL